MKIAYVTMLYPVKSEFFATRDIKELESNGTQVDIYSFKPQDQETRSLIKERNIDEKKLNYFSFKSLIFLLKQPKFLLYLFYKIFTHSTSVREFINLLLLIPRSIEITSAIIKKDYDHAHLFWGHYPSLVGLLLSKFSKVKFSMFLGAYDLEMELGISKAACSKASKVFTHSKYNAEVLKKNFGVDAEVSYRSIDIPNQLPEQIQKKPKLIVTVGRLIKDKGHSISINVMKECLKLDSNYELIIIGDGPEKECLKKEIEDLNLADKIKITGYLPNDQVLSLLHQSTGFFLFSTSQSERLPNVVKEAMLFESIPFISNTKGIEELATNRCAVIFNNLSNPTAMAKKVNEIITNEKSLKSMTSHGKEIIIQNFSIKKNMQKYSSHWTSS